MPADSDPTASGNQLPDLNIAAKIRNPVSLLALVAMVSGFVLSKVAQQANPIIATLLIILMLAIVVSATFIAAQRGAKGAQIALQQVVQLEPQPIKQRKLGRQKTFLSAPMASASEQDYNATKREFLEIRERLRIHAQQVEVYWGGAEVPPSGDWNDAAAALRQTMERIQDCDNFVLVLPDYVCTPRKGICKPSSIWWEVGMAIALHKPCAFFVHERIEKEEASCLPYYLKGVREAKPEHDLPKMKLWRFKALADILQRVDEAGTSIFPA